MVAIRPLPLIFLTLACLLAPASASAAEPTERIIVQHEPGVTGSEQRDIRSDVDATLVDSLDVPRTDVIAVDRSDVIQALRELNRDPEVAIAERDQIVHALSNDPQYSQLWGLRSILAPEAWELSVGTGRTVAVVDSGILATHEDFPNTETDPDRIAAGYDWVDEDATPNDLDGHGTHVAGTIAAAKDNGVGIAGVAPDARVLPLRVLDATGSGYLSDIINALQFAGDEGVQVVNASFGGSTYSALERQVIEAHPKTLYVTAAGNGGADSVGDDVDTSPVYPCAFPSANVLCVGAYTKSNVPAAFSNYGTNSVDVFAPGQSIDSTWKNGDYAFASGTSMAAPHVAGLAALLLARNPNLTTAQIKAAIMSTVVPANVPASYTSVSGGRIDARAAVVSVLADRDGDTVQDDLDNCPDVANEDQDDADENGTGDACEPGAPAPDADADHVADTSDHCPQETGEVSAQGCPGAASDSNGDGLPDMFDADNDGVANSDDNCPTRSNRNQADADRDRVGDVCDSTPRGPDADRDGRALIDDACPTVYARTANGCPTPVVPAIPDSDGDGRRNNVDACPYERAAGTLNGCPLPAVTALSAKPRKKGGKRYAAVAVRTSRGATVKITVQRKKGKRWVKVTRKTLATSSRNRVALNTKRLKRGRYRVVVVASSAAGRAAAVKRSFRVR
jgi:thermitase